MGADIRLTRNNKGEIELHLNGAKHEITLPWGDTSTVYINHTKVVSTHEELSTVLRRMMIMANLSDLPWFSEGKTQNLVEIGPPLTINEGNDIRSEQ